MYYEYQWQELLYMGFVFGLGFLGAVLVVAVVLGIVGLIITYSEEIGAFFGVLVLILVLLGIGIGIFVNFIDWFNTPD